GGRSSFRFAFFFSPVGARSGAASPSGALSARLRPLASPGRALSAASGSPVRSALGQLGQGGFEGPGAGDLGGPGAVSGSGQEVGGFGAGAGDELGVDPGFGGGFIQLVLVEDDGDAGVGGKPHVEEEVGGSPDPLGHLGRREDVRV